MSPWLVTSFPLPEGVGGTYQFGYVTAASEDEARQLVLDTLVAQTGLDITDIPLTAVGLALWHDDSLPFGKSMLHNG